MRERFLGWSTCWAIGLAIAWLIGGQTSAQDLNLDFGLGGQQEGPEIEYSGDYVIDPESGLGQIRITANIKEGWHTYAIDQPAGASQPTIITVKLNEQVLRVGLFEPDEAPVEKYSEAFNVTERLHDFLVTWRAPVEFADGVEFDALEVEVEISAQVCLTGCLPVDDRLQLGFAGNEPLDYAREDLEVVLPDTAGPAAEESGKAVQQLSDEELAEIAKLYDPEQPIEYDAKNKAPTFWVAMLGIFFGGMLLNLMPCVFPMLGLKVLGFVDQAGKDKWKIKVHGIAYAVGLILCVWVLGGALLAIRFASGGEINWGAQMGNPYFMGFIIILLFGLGLNLVGVFEIGLFMTRLGGGESKGGYFGSFISGVLTTLVATPCSGPFLGAAMSYTLIQPVAIAMFLLTVFGLGIAAPYVLLSFFPALTKALPRPGGWMETFKKLMGFTMFGAAAFFARSFGAQTGVDGYNWLLVAICVLSLAAFFYGKWSPGYTKFGTKLVWGWVTPLILAGVGVWVFTIAAAYEAPPVRSDGKWELWAPGIVEHRQSEGKIVWVDYTADWCATCQLNKQRIFSNAAVKKRLSELGVHLVRVDMSRNDEALTRDLKRADRSVIPVNLIYPADYPRRKAILLEELLSPADALEALEKVK